MGRLSTDMRPRIFVSLNGARGPISPLSVNNIGNEINKSILTSNLSGAVLSLTIGH